MSCDLLPTERPGPHHQGDVREILNDGWDVLIGFPPCTYIAVSGISWNYHGRGWKETGKALDFVRLLMHAEIEHIAIENPVSLISTAIRRPDQIIQPYQFGHDHKKSTCLWLKNLPPLQPTRYIEPRIHRWKKRWANQDNKGRDTTPNTPDRGKIKAKTFEGVAEAMAIQWTAAILHPHAT